MLSSIFETERMGFRLRVSTPDMVGRNFKFDYPHFDIGNFKGVVI